MHRPISLAFSAILLAGSSLVAHAAGPDPKAILTTYADIGQAIYQDSITEAEKLKTAVDAFLANPNDDTLKAARTAWIVSRVPYMQSEAFRFGNSEIDDLEGNVNSWPLDEGLIDYVDSSYGTTSDSNPYYTLNVIANPSLKLGDKTVDASKITPDLITSLQSAGDNEANVAIGYHAIEFLLWGQDLHGTGPGAGERPRHRLQHHRLHPWQLRSPCRLPAQRKRTADHRPEEDGSGVRRRWSGAARACSPIRRPAWSPCSPASAASPTASSRASAPSSA